MKSFEQAADHLFESVLAHIAVLSIDFDDGHDFLRLIMPDQRVYLFNVHRGIQQLWLSSPISGGHHFVWTNINPMEGAETSVCQSEHKTKVVAAQIAVQGWQDTRGRASLMTLMAQEWQAVFGLPWLDSMT